MFGSVPIFDLSRIAMALEQFHNYYLQVQTSVTNWCLIVGMGALGFKGMSDENETDSQKYKFFEAKSFFSHPSQVQNIFQLSLQRKKRTQIQTNLFPYFTNCSSSQ